MEDYFEIENVKELRSDFDFKNKLFIAVFNPQSIPPHLILISDNLYFDLRIHKSRIAENFEKDKVDVVVGPAIGGIILAYSVAKALKCRGIFLEREEGLFTLRRGFHIAHNERVLLVEDVISTGKSVDEVLTALPRELADGRIVGLGYLVDRSQGKAKFPLPKAEPLMRLDLPTYKPEECPLCAKGYELTKRGSRKI